MFPLTSHDHKTDNITQQTQTQKYPKLLFEILQTVDTFLKTKRYGVR